LAVQEVWKACVSCARLKNEVRWFFNDLDDVYIMAKYVGKTLYIYRPPKFVEKAKEEKREEAENCSQGADSQGEVGSQNQYEKFFIHLNEYCNKIGVGFQAVSIHCDVKGAYYVESPIFEVVNDEKVFIFHHEKTIGEAIKSFTERLRNTHLVFTCGTRQVYVFCDEDLNFSIEKEEELKDMECRSTARKDVGSKAELVGSAAPTISVNIPLRDDLAGQALLGYFINPAYYEGNDDMARAISAYMQAKSTGAAQKFKEQHGQ